MIVVDANVLIAHLDQADRHHARAVELMAKAAEELLAASVLTVAEVLVGPTRAGRLETARAALDDLEVQEIPFGPGASTRLAVLRAETALKLPNCCVLLAVEDAKASALATFDERLDAHAARRGMSMRQSTPGVG